MAVDLIRMQPLGGVHFLHGDMTDPNTLDSIAEFYGFSKIDLIVSDMAPEFTGDMFIDHT